MEENYILIIFATLCICILIYKLVGSRNGRCDGKELPGPKSLPLIGNVFDVDLLRLHHSVSRMVQTFGPIFRIKLLGRNVVLINDAELEREAFGSEKYGVVFNDRPAHFWGKYICFDSTDITNANEKTMTKRKMLHRSLEFFGDGIENFNRINKDELWQVIEKLKLTNQCDFDLSAIISTSLANTLSGLLNGTSPTKADCEAIKRFADLGNFFFSGMGFLYDLIPTIRFLPGVFSKRYREAIAARDHLLNRFYFSAIDKVDKTGTMEDCLIKNLLLLQFERNQKEKTEYITENDMKGIILSIIGASQDTTSAVLTNAFAIMLTHPNVAKKIQEEIDNIVGPYNLPHYSDQEKMHYTMATVYEVLRYTSPVVLGIPHRTAKDQNFEGYFVAKDSLLMPNHWYILHDPALWHEPWVFAPERFLDGAGKILPLESKQRRNLMAFSTGCRECPGENFGKSRVFFYLTAVLQSFHITPASNGQLPNSDPRNYDAHGVDLAVRPYHCRAIPRVVPR